MNHENAPSTEDVTRELAESDSVAADQSPVSNSSQVEQDAQSQTPAGLPETDVAETPVTESPATEAVPRKKKRKPKRRRPTRIDRLVMEFQPDVVEIENRPIPGGARWTLYAVMALIAGTIAWSCWAKVDRIVIGQGKLITTEPPIVIQPITLSPIRSIKVKFGDVVRAGDVLAELDPTFAQAEYAQGKMRDEAFTAMITRLQAEREGKPYYVDPATATLSQLNEFSVYQDRETEYEARIRELDSAIKALKTRRENNRNDQADLRDQVTVLEKMMEKTKEGVRRNVISESTELSQHSELLGARRSYNTAIRRAQEFEDEIANTELQKETLKAEWNTRVSSELLQARQQKEQNLQSITKTERMKDLIDLRVPSDLDAKRFMVMDVAERSVGSVLREGESLFRLMPLNVELVAEIEVQGKDIATIQENIPEETPVRLKFESFPYQKHGTIEGKLIAISESSFQKGEDNRQQTFYRARVELLNPDALEDVPNDVLMPGMIATAEIKVGERRVIEYFLHPLLKGFDSSLREP